MATGPLTSIALAEAIRAHTGETDLAFFDAIAPIVYFDTVDMTRPGAQAVYDKAGPGGRQPSINCPMTGVQPSSARCSPLPRPSSATGKEHALFRRLPADR